MQLSESLEVIALALFVYGIFVLAGLGGALIAAAAALFVVAYALDGVSVYPHKVAVLGVKWLSSKLKRGRE